MSNHRFAIWWLLEEEHSDRYQLEINKLAERFSTPLFLPHITVVSGIEDKAIGRRLVDQLSEHTIRFDAKIDKLEHRAIYYQSFFLHLRSATFHSTWARCKHAASSPVATYEPHLSLLYQSPELFDHSAFSVFDPPTESITIDKVALFETSGVVETWQCILTRDLQNA
ncbi:MAG: hypothetical protein AAF434_10580 [Pseudomonadota bacterium]